MLHENDIDYLLARDLAVNVIKEKAFEPITQESYEKAERQMEQCSKVYCSLHEFGFLNEKNKKLLETAKSMGKLL